MCKHLEKHYLSLLNSKFERINESYLKHLYGLNLWLDFEIGEIIKNLLVKGVGITGLLILEDKQGKTLEVDVKEVKWLF